MQEALAAETSCFQSMKRKFKKLKHWSALQAAPVQLALGCSDAPARENDRPNYPVQSLVMEGREQAARLSKHSPKVCCSTIRVVFSQRKRLWRIRSASTCRAPLDSQIRTLPERLSRIKICCSSGTNTACGDRTCTGQCPKFNSKPVFKSHIEISDSLLLGINCFWRNAHPQPGPKGYRTAGPGLKTRKHL